jgi:phosphonoacetaldehyde hydrolase
MEFSYQRSYRGPLKAAILDWAGTTVDYGCVAPAVVFVEVFKNHGVDITMEQAREPMGAEKRKHIQEIIQMDAVQKTWQEVHKKAPTEADVDQLYAEFIPKQVACIAEYADLIPGTVETIGHMRSRGMKIGGTTGYSSEMTDVLGPEAAKRGYQPDVSIAANHVPAGRPAPWMAIKAAMDLGVYPMEACVKIGDTVPDIAEGLNAAMWSVGVVMTGNEIGMSEAELGAAEVSFIAAKRDRAYTKLSQAGAHYIVDSISDIPPILDAIDARLAQGDRP